MAKIPEEVIETVRTSTNIADFVGQYVQLKKQGQNLFGLCPFHEEKTPSFSVNEQKQIFHCFSCGRGGSVFNFIMELENLSFPEAVVKVADFAHVSIEDDYRQSEKAAPVDRTTGQLITLHEDAAKLYHHILVNTAAGEPALEYLHERGMSDDMINVFNLGFAPASRLLKPFVDERDLDYQLLRQSGLFSENDAGELRDRFVDRVMYPIRNASGQTIAFSGRMLEVAPDQPKYLNSPETKLFNKRKVLFNFDQARGEIRKEHQVILFEGFMDVISAFQAGIRNGIASMGTSLTNEQIYAIERVTDSLLIAYDGDQPGQKATNRAISMLRENSRLSLGVIQMPDGVDPDEYRRAHGDEQFATAMQTARETPVAFQLHYLQQGHNLAQESDRVAYLNDALAVLVSVTSPVEVDVYLSDLAKQFDLDKGALKSQLDSLKRESGVTKERQRRRNAVAHIEAPPAPSVFEQPTTYDRVTLAERHLLARMLQNHSVWLKVAGLPDFCFVHDNYQSLFLLAQGYFEGHPTYSSAQFSDFITDANMRRLLVDLETITLSTTIGDGEIDDYVQIIMQQAPVQEQLNQKKAALREATRLGDHAEEQKLVLEIIKLQREKQLRKQA